MVKPMMGRRVFGTEMQQVAEDRRCTSVGTHSTTSKDKGMVWTRQALVTRELANL